MQLHDKSGIACDLCGMVFNNDFTYYSYDFRPIGQRLPSNQIFQIAIISSLDVCGTCFEKHKTIILQNYEKLFKTKKLYCEISGQNLNKDHYHCNISEVFVHMSGQSFTCAKCGKVAEGKKSCKCGHDKFIRQAVVRVQDRLVEINISEAVFTEFRSKAESMRHVAGQWATTS